MENPTITSPQRNHSMTSFHNCHPHSSNLNPDLTHFHNIFPTPPKNSLKRSTRSETHLTDMRNFAYPSEKVVPYQLRQKVKEFMSNEELMRNTRLLNVPSSSSSSNLRQFVGTMGSSSENIEKGEHPSLYKSFHSLSLSLFRGSGTLKNKVGTSQTISEEGETDTLEQLPPRIRKTSSASKLDILSRDFGNSNFERNMLKSKEYSQSNVDTLNDPASKEGLTMTIDKAKPNENITNALDKSTSSGNIFNRSDLSNDIKGKIDSHSGVTCSSNEEIHKSGGVFGIFGKGIFGKPVSANENETARYILTLEQ
uniref:Protein kinase domain-containing protein n=1 Tax=Strongyloides venezuelensis TaxID=75913 RepID=A0A0K0F0D5_STRVS